MNEVILSILIPTYNRKEYLYRLIKNIEKEILCYNLNKSIEIIVSDNNSSDNSIKIIEDFKLKFNKKGIKFKGWKNDINFGPDKNFYLLVKESQGKFCWILGDDELLEEGRLKEIIDILYNNLKIAHLYLKNTKRKKLEYKIYNSKKKILREINYEISFISANIFNKKYIDFRLDYFNFFETNLLQEYFYFQAILSGKLFGVIEGKIFTIGKAENLGGYKFFKVFSENQNNVYKYFLDKGLTKNIVDYLNNKIIIYFFPEHILNYRKNLMKNNWPEEDIERQLRKSFEKYLLFYMICYPLLKFPLSLSQVYLFFIKLTRKVIRVIF